MKLETTTFLSYEVTRSQLIAFVNQTFPGTLSLKEFLTKFNALFKAFASDASNKLSVESMKKGTISCTGASLIVAYWAEKKTKGSVAIFLSYNGENTSYNSSYVFAHSSVSIPYIEKTQPKTCIEYMGAGNLSKVDTPQSNNLREIFHSPDEFLKNRLAAFQAYALLKSTKKT